MDHSSGYGLKSSNIHSMKTIHPFYLIKGMKEIELFNNNIYNSPEFEVSNVKAYNA